MGKYRKTKHKPRLFEKRGNSNLSCVLYAEMLQSPAWYQLSNNAKVLYSYMKLQLYGQKDKPQERQDCFVFNKAMYTKTYPLFKNGEQFNKHCHELIQYGFIEEVENGHTTRTKNIYRYSDKWQSWEAGIDYRPIAMIQHDTELKARRKAQSRKNK